MATPLARKGLLRLQAIPLGFTLTLWAFLVLAEPGIEQVFKASFIIWKLFEELADAALFHAI